MTILLVMVLGVLIGRFIFPEKAKKAIDTFASVCTLILIFTMGLTLGRRPNFLTELDMLGLRSFIYFIFPTLFSLLAVFYATKCFMTKKEKKNDRPKEDE